MTGRWAYWEVEVAAAVVVAASLSLAGVVEAWLSFAGWGASMMTLRVLVEVRPDWSAAT